MGNSLNIETKVKPHPNYFFKVMMGILGYCKNSMAQISSIQCPSTVTLRFARKLYGGEYGCGVNYGNSYCPLLQKPFCSPKGFCMNGYEFKNKFNVYPKKPKDRTVGRRLLSVEKLVSNSNHSTAININKRRTLSNDKNSLRFLQTFTSEGLKAQRESAKKINGTKKTSDP